MIPMHKRKKTAFGQTTFEQHSRTRFLFGLLFRLADSGFGDPAVDGAQDLKVSIVRRAVLLGDCVHRRIFAQVLQQGLQVACEIDDSD
jgi:hypothetical protein